MLLLAVFLNGGRGKVELGLRGRFFFRVIPIRLIDFRDYRVVVR